MAWQNPAYAFAHAIRDAPGVLTTPTAGNDSELVRLADDRAGALYTFDSAAVKHDIDIDLGSTPPTLDRLVIPAGHNIPATTTIKLIADPAVVPVTVVDITGAPGLISADFSQIRSDQFYQLDLTDVTPTAWSLGELILSSTRTLTIGPEQDWPDRFEPNTLIFQKPNGVQAGLELGPDQRVIEYVYGMIDAADEKELQDLWELCGTARPFVLDPAYDDETPLWVRLEQFVARRLDTPLPVSQPRMYERRMVMREHVG